MSNCWRMLYVSVCCGFITGWCGIIMFAVSLGFLLVLFSACECLWVLGALMVYRPSFLSQNYLPSWLLPSLGDSSSYGKENWTYFEARRSEWAGLLCRVWFFYLDIFTFEYISCLLGTLSSLSLLGVRGGNCLRWHFLTFVSCFFEQAALQRTLRRNWQLMCVLIMEFEGLDQEHTNL